MNEFSQFMGDAFGTSQGIMGDDIVLNGVPVKAVTVRFQKSSAAAERGGGRTLSQAGAVEVSIEDWRASGARQGALIEHPIHGRMKITNTPNEAMSVVTLEVAGVAQ